MGIYSRDKKTEAISVRMAPGLKDRVTFECEHSGKWNRNRFINLATMLLLDLRQEVRCGNINIDELPGTMGRFCTLLM